MLRWSINLFRVRGIQLAVHVSFLALLAYFAWDGYNDAGANGAWWGVALLVAFFTCIVLHELGHSLTAMHYGINVRRILLLPIGGMAEFETIPRSPRQELLITVAGPAVNFVIFGLFELLGRFLVEPMRTTPASLAELGYELMVWNLWIGIFNLTPAFPMDGGRILRACLAFKLPYARATFWAATIGKMVAGVGIVLAFWFHLWLLLALFVFILAVGEMEYRGVLIQERRDAEWAEIARRLERVPPPHG